jgi:hypothetical protein
MLLSGYVQALFNICAIKHISYMLLIVRLNLDRVRNIG